MIEIATLTAYNKATADPLRLQILRVLCRESFGVLELCHILGVTQPALSHHLKILNREGLLDTRRQGTSIYYRRALVIEADPFSRLRQALFDIIDELPLTGEQEEKIEDIYTERRNQAQDFFERNAVKLQDNQDLIAELSQYVECVENLIANNFPKGHAIAIEVGPGDSELILKLSGYCRSVAAIDNSPEMLDRTRQRIEASGAKNVSLLNGELSGHESSVDLIIANMVLHHLPSPARFFHDAATRLNPSGQLLIADLTSHDQEWTRDACGDLWPGFDPEELDNWAAASGLEPGQSAYLGLKNGFQVQVRTFLQPT